MPSADCPLKTADTRKKDTNEAQAQGSLEEEDFGEQRESRVRPYAVDTPERGEPCF